MSKGLGKGSHMQAGQAAKWSKPPQRKEQQARPKREECEEAAKRQAEAAGPAATSSPAKRSRFAVGVAQFSSPPYDLMTNPLACRPFRRDLAAAAVSLTKLTPYSCFTAPARFTSLTVQRNAHCGSDKQLRCKKSLRAVKSALYMW